MISTRRTSALALATLTTLAALAGLAAGSALAQSALKVAMLPDGVIFQHPKYPAALCVADLTNSFAMCAPVENVISIAEDPSTEN